MNDHIKRILEMSNYDPKKGKIVENINQPQQPQNTQQQGQGIDGNFEKEFQAALDQVIRTLPQALNNFARTNGDRDGQIEPKGGSQNNGQQGNPQQNNEDIALQEAIGGLVAGTALAVPAIGNLLGKAISFTGKKIDNQTVQKMGAWLEHKAHALHHKYEALIDKALSPVTKYLTPSERETINKIVFYGIVVGLGGAGAFSASKALGASRIGLAAVESGLSSVKAGEILSVAKDVIPRVLGTLID